MFVIIIRNVDSIVAGLKQALVSGCGLLWVWFGQSVCDVCIVGHFGTELNCPL